MKFGRTALLLAGIGLSLPSGLAIADHPVSVFGPAAGGPVVTPTADLLPSGKWALVLYNEYRSFESTSRQQLSDQASQAGGHAHALDHLWAPSVSLAYGLSDALTVAARLPYVKRKDLREAHVHGDESSGVHALGDAAGLGDASRGAYWRFWKGNGGDRAALSFGTFAPTGSTHEETDQGERLETEHQPGSGAWNPFVGLTYSKAADRLGLHANVRYRWAMEGAQNTDLGDRLDYGVAAVYRLSSPEISNHRHRAGGATPNHHHERVGLSWDLMLDLGGEHQEGQQVRGKSAGDSEYILFLSPGVRVAGRGWTAALSVGVPVDQEVGEDHVDADWRAVTTLGFTF